MRKYIVHLTNDLIGKNRLDEVVKRLRASGGEDAHPDVVFDHVALMLEVSDIQIMNPETLGKILCSFDSGDVTAKNPFREIGFSGHVKPSLQQLVARCLTSVILDRLDPEAENPNIPKYVK